MGSRGLAVLKYATPALLLAVVFVLYAYFSSDAAQIEDDIPTRWNRAIERPGFEPIYPPQEAIEVGDIFIKISLPEIDDADHVQNIDAYIGRTIRIAHEDISSAELNAELHVQLPDTKFGKDDSVAYEQSQEGALIAGSETYRDKIHLAEVGFPAAKLARITNANSFLTWLGGDFGNEDTSSLLFSHVQTYGISPVAAAWKLQKFCENGDDVCFRDDSARYLFAKTLGGAVNCLYKGRYLYNIEMFLVSQVFTARAITVATNSSDKMELFAGDSPKASEAKARVSNSASVDLNMDEKFERPLAFAFKKVGIKIPGDPPKDGTACKLKGQAQ